jgi:hypothetical protein
MVVVFLGIEIPFATNRRRRLFRFFWFWRICTRQSSGIDGVRRLDRTSVLRAPHHVPEGEKDRAQKHHAEKKSHEMTALENPLTAAFCSARHR